MLLRGEQLHGGDKGEADALPFDRDRVGLELLGGKAFEQPVEAEQRVEFPPRTGVAGVRTLSH